MQQLIEVSAAVVGGRVPLGIITVRQALNLPEIADFRFRRTSDEDGKTTAITRQDLQKLAQQYSIGWLSLRYGRRASTLAPEFLTHQKFHAPDPSSVPGREPYGTERIIPVRMGYPVSGRKVQERGA